MEPADRQIIVLRQWDELEFSEIAARMGGSPDGARMRFQRALPKLALRIQRLQRGELEDLAEKQPD
jgi:DNA-directed RNA polymerase specialized sigma24 family protein